MSSRLVVNGRRFRTTCRSYLEASKSDRYVIPKHRYPTTKLRSVTSHKKISRLYCGDGRLKSRKINSIFFKHGNSTDRKERNIPWEKEARRCTWTCITHRLSWGNGKTEVTLKTMPCPEAEVFRHE